MLKERRTARAHLAAAAATAARNPEDPDAAAAVVERRREYAEVSLAEHILKVVAAAPPLTPEQRDRLAALLRPTASGAA